VDGIWAEEDCREGAEWEGTVRGCWRSQEEEYQFLFSMGRFVQNQALKREGSSHKKTEKGKARN
jgi:hypothetical protein